MEGNKVGERPSKAKDGVAHIGNPELYVSRGNLPACRNPLSVSLRPLT
jgi:hypothetical protein